MLTGKKEEHRDIAAIGLKTIIAEIPAGSHNVATSVSAIIASKTIEGASSKVGSGGPPLAG